MIYGFYKIVIQKTTSSFKFYYTTRRQEATLRAFHLRISHGRHVGINDTKKLKSMKVKYYSMAWSHRKIN